MKIDCNENINTDIPAVQSPKTAAQHCLSKGYPPHKEGQQHLQRFNSVGVTQGVAGAEVRGDGEAVALWRLHASVSLAFPKL